MLGGSSHGSSHSLSGDAGTGAGSAGLGDAAPALATAAQHSAGGRRLLQDLLTPDGGMADPLLFDYMNTNQLLGGEHGRGAWTLAAEQVPHNPEHRLLENSSLPWHAHLHWPAV